MSDEHFCELTAEWGDGGFSGKGQLHVGELQFETSFPKQFKGRGVGTNPEELVLAAAADCYLFALAALLDIMSVPYQQLTLKSKAVFGLKMGRPELKRIEHYPKVTVAEGDYDEMLGRVKQHFHLALDSSTVAEAMKGNVEIVIEGEVEKV